MELNPITVVCMNPFGQLQPIKGVLLVGSVAVRYHRSWFASLPGEQGLWLSKVLRFRAKAAQV